MTGELRALLTEDGRMRAERDELAAQVRELRRIARLALRFEAAEAERDGIDEEEEMVLRAQEMRDGLELIADVDEWPCPLGPA